MAHFWNSPVVALFCLSFLWAVLFPLSHAAHSQKRVGTRTRIVQVYDRSITTFDPQGRLLQVEYGLQAAQRGSPLVAVLFNSTIYVGMLGRSEKGIKSNDILPIHRLDRHLCLLTSGLVGDGLALAGELRINALQHRWMYGEPSTVYESALQAATLQHGLTKRAGSRPLGVTGLVVGWDGQGTSNISSKVHIYCSQPGGTLEDCWYATAGRDQETLLAKWHALYPTLSSPADVVRGLLETLDTTSTHKSQRYQVWILQPNTTTLSLDLTCLHDLAPTVSDQELEEILSSLEGDTGAPNSSMGL